jgi:hypothetical protein
MTLFIQKGNIKIIWDVISMCPIFNEIFTTDDTKKEWFNRIIGQVQDQLGRNVSMKELGNVNRETIKLMMANLKKNYFVISTDIDSRQKPLIIGSESDTPFLRRKEEYEKMKSVYIMEVDKPMTNMNELVEKYQNQRVDAYSSKDSTSLEKKVPNDKHVTWTTHVSQSDNTISNELKFVNKKLDMIIKFLNLPSLSHVTDRKRRNSIYIIVYLLLFSNIF